ncbi:MAG: cupredoxin family protein [Hydrogenophaga sp.]|jgi:uncharacterized cupredoxin-like copper-binding protein|nr:cupredoxin family protein [Hydrogenophaga sp.]
MNPIRRHTTQLVALAPLAWLAPGAAHAHAEHHGRAATGPVVKEQKPWGIAAEPKEAKRRIDIRMTDDMRFTPSHIHVREGEVLRLRAVNTGKVMHEIVIGTPEELQAHAELMKKHPNMEHEEPYMAHVSPGRSGDIVWHFNRPGNFEFACLIPGHFEAGMRGTIRVRPRA